MVLILVGFVGGLFFLIFYAPLDTAKIKNVEGVAKYVCVTKRDWYRKNYNKECRLWEELVE